MNNDLLVNSYFQAVDLKLEIGFIYLLFNEIKLRKIDIGYFYDGGAGI
ncbi:sporulation histidine kinase inhibitor Sda [Paenibacillus agricola]|nr:sporulation histidine kinase inhibitor Sda [Paenibacillus agricola]